MAIKWINPSGLNEIAKSTALALLDNDLHSIHMAVNCKDYIQDLFWCEINKQSGSVYGFRWSPKLGEKFLNQEKFLIGFTCGSIARNKKVSKFLDKNIEGAAKLVNTIEDSLGIEHSKFFRTGEDEFYVEFDKKWTEKPPLISTLILMIRAGLDYVDHSIDPQTFLLQIGRNTNLNFAFGDNAAAYISSRQSQVKEIFDGTWNPKMKWSKPSDILMAHNYSGFCNYAQNQ